MSALKKQKPSLYPVGGDNQGSEVLKKVKLEAEELRKKLQHSILDNPKLSKKAALLISLWAQGRGPKPRKK